MKDEHGEIVHGDTSPDAEFESPDVMRQMAITMECYDKVQRTRPPAYGMGLRETPLFKSQAAKYGIYGKAGPELDLGFAIKSNVTPVEQKYFAKGMDRNAMINGWKISDFNYWLHGNPPYF